MEEDREVVILGANDLQDEQEEADGRREPAERRPFFYNAASTSFLEVGKLEAASGLNRVTGGASDFLTNFFLTREYATSSTTMERPTEAIMINIVNLDHRSVFLMAIRLSGSAR